MKPLKNDSSLFPIGLGCYDLSLIEKADGIKLIKEAYQLGVNFFDTADVYFQGENERVLGIALEGIRDQILLATKCGMLQIAEETVDENGYLYMDPKDLDGSPEHIFETFEQSLERLQTDYIDILYLHRLDPKVKLERSVHAMAELVKKNQVRYLGLSEVSAAQIRQAHAIHPISFVQSEFSLCSREMEQHQVLKTCEELGITFVAYSPISKGLLSGQFNGDWLPKNDYRHHLPRFEKNNLKENIKLRNFAEQLAKMKGFSLTQLALAWIRAKNIVSIPGTTKLEHLKENLNSINLNLTHQEIQVLDRTYPYGIFNGARYPLLSHPGNDPHDFDVVD